jgi:dolichyldiphosphatase
MAYFATFLILHLHFRHRFVSTGVRILDRLFRLILHVAFISWAAIVAYSRYVGVIHVFLTLTYRHRYYLSYHSPTQIFWGISIGVTFGAIFYLITEFIPTRRPNSYLGQARVFILTNPISTWLRIRDGWAVWPDSGTEEHWKLWRKQWEKQVLNKDL